MTCTYVPSRHARMAKSTKRTADAGDSAREAVSLVLARFAMSFSSLGAAGHVLRRLSSGRLYRVRAAFECSIKERSGGFSHALVRGRCVYFGDAYEAVSLLQPC